MASPARPLKNQAPATRKQLEALRAIRRHEQETLRGMTEREIGDAIGSRYPKSVIDALETKGWIQRDGYTWFVTDDGIDVLDEHGLEGA